MLTRRRYSAGVFAHPASISMSLSSSAPGPFRAGGFRLPARDQHVNQGVHLGQVRRAQLARRGGRDERPGLGRGGRPDRQARRGFA